MRRTKRAATPSGATTTRARRLQLLLDPARHGDVGQVDDVVAVHVRDEQRVELGRLDAGIEEAQHRGSARIELQRDVAVADERAGARGTRAGGAGRRCR